MVNIYAKGFGMNIHYKIVEVWPQDHLIVARYWTDNISEEFLNSHPDNQNRMENGSPLRCRTDVAISLPIPTPQGQELDDIILKNAPVDFLKTLEYVQNPSIDTSMSSILDLKDKTFVQKDIEQTLAGVANQRELTEEEIEKLISLVTNK